MIYTWELSFHWQLYAVNQGLGLICISRLEGSTETKFPTWLFTKPRETLAFAPHLCQLRFLYCSPNGQGLRWGGQSGNFFTFLPKPEETLFLESCGKECMQTAECFGKLVSKHLECLSSPYFKTADFCFLKAEPLPSPTPSLSHCCSSGLQSLVLFMLGLKGVPLPTAENRMHSRLWMWTGSWVTIHPHCWGSSQGGERVRFPKWSMPSLSNRQGLQFWLFIQMWPQDSGKLGDLGSCWHYYYYYLAPWSPQRKAL